MTRTHVLAGALALLCATAAVAQTPPPPPGGPRPGPDAGVAPPLPPGGPRGRREAADPPPPPPPKGAHFRLERGDARLDVKCADDEPMRACADITLQLLDRISSLKPADTR